MRSVFRLSILLFGLLLLITIVTLTLRRQSPFDDQWATLVITDPPPRAAFSQLQLFHPQTGYTRTVATFKDNTGVEYVHWSPDGEWVIVAIRGRPGESHLFRVHWTGRDLNPIQLNSPSIALHNAVWSPNGEYALMWDPSSQSNTWDIVMMSADGRQYTIIDHLMVFGSSSVSARWSPDSEWVVVAATNTDRQVNMMRVRPDEERFAAFPLLNGFVESIAVSPDSKWLAFSLYSTARSSVYRIQVDGGSLEPLIEDDPSQYVNLWWTDEGQLMAVQQAAITFKYSIGHIDPHLGGYTPLIANINTASPLIWSHDRTQFASIVAEDNRAVLLTANVDASNEFRLRITVCGPTLVDPVWSIDDQWLLLGLNIGGNCIPHRYRPHSDPPQPLFDLASDYQFDFLAPFNPQWSIVHQYTNNNLNLQSYFVHQQTGQLVPIPGGRVVAWSKIPLKDQSLVTSITLGGILILAQGAMIWRRGIPK